MSKQNARIMRTLNELAEFDFEVKYRPGTQNAIPDTLSRLRSTNESPALSEIQPLPKGLEVMNNVPGGGDSMVDSILLALDHVHRNVDPEILVPDSTDDLRNILVGEILNFPERYSLKRNRNSKSAVKLMRLPGQLPSRLFLQACANVFSLPIWVHGESSRPLNYEPIKQHADTHKERHVHLRCLAGVHYDPLIASGSYEPPGPPVPCEPTVIIVIIENNAC